MRGRGAIAACGLLVATLLTGPAVGGNLPAQQQALLLLRTLAYDRNVKVVLTKDGPCGEMKSALVEAAKQLTVGGLQVKVVGIEWSAKEAESRLAAVKPAAAYLCGSFDAVLDEVTAVTRKLSALSFSPNGGDVENGVSIGLVSKGDKAALLVNLPATRSEGAELDSAVLRVAEIVRR